MGNRARRARVVIAGCGALLCAFASAADMPLAACDADSHQAVLSASGERMEARAVWLNRRLAKWPGVDANGAFKLYFSPVGSISAKAGAAVSGAAGALALDVSTDAVPDRFKHVGAGVVLAVRDRDTRALHRQQLVLVREGVDGKVLDATRVQSAGALDDLFATAGAAGDLGVSVGKHRTAFKVWAPTAQQVAVCTYDSGASRASAIRPMKMDRQSGIWSAAATGDLSGKYYTYLVDVAVDGAGIVRNRVTDPYSVSLTTDSKRSYIASLDAPALKPRGWDSTRTPGTVRAQTDMVVYELHVRDFSINDPSVSAPHRGKYGAFGETGSNGMKHLAALSRAGLTDVHLLPIYDIGSVPEAGCRAETISGKADGEEQQALVTKNAEADCFNWGYDPFHYSAPEGSYASDPRDGAHRIIETRGMVMNLHRIGLRVGMDVVYNHTFRSGQDEKSVLDRIVPGYYHRLNEAGVVERSTCCDNTATENLMMGKLMIDSAVLWAKHYRIDSFRFDLMGHQPRAVMEQLQRSVNRAAGHPVQLIGEGWNFGEVADGKRFVQASQLSLNGSGIGTFSDRARDAVRGGAASDAGDKLFKLQGYINGLTYDPNALAGKRPTADLLQASDMVKVGLAGSVRSYPLVTHDGATRLLKDVDYNGQPAGYASEPAEAVNYVENHDNQTLYDINAFKLPLATSSADRARVQMLAAAINAFSQGVAYFHAGVDTLRSKSLDRNSFNSGDWFNRIDWSYQDNYFGTGAPPAEDNGADYALLKPLLANPALKPAPADIAFARDVFRDLLAIRASSSLFRLRSAADIEQRLRFHNTGPAQVPTVIAGHLDGNGYLGAAFKDVSYFINVDKVSHSLTIDAEKAKRYRLHPAHRADPRAGTATYNSATGMFTIPPRTAVVFVQ
jgi:pullulanase